MMSPERIIMPIKILKKIIFHHWTNFLISGINIIWKSIIISVLCGCVPHIREARYYDRCGIMRDWKKEEVVYIDERFTEEERGGILEGIREINWGMYGIEELVVGRYGGEVEIMEKVVREGRGYMIIRLDRGSELVIDKAGELTMGFAGIGGRYMYLIPENMKRGEMKAVVVHEWLHMKGVRHEGMGERLMGCIGEKESKEIRRGICDRWCYY